MVDTLVVPPICCEWTANYRTNPKKMRNSAVKSLRQNMTSLKMTHILTLKHSWNISCLKCTFMVFNINIQIKTCCWYMLFGADNSIFMSNKVLHANFTSTLEESALKSHGLIDIFEILHSMYS